VNLYRLDKNYERMNNSHRQLGFPEFNGNEMIELTKKLIELDKDWIPERPLHSMYLRPFSIAMDNKIGMNSIDKMKLMVCMSPVGPYYPRGFVPLKLYCETNVVRAWPQGFGDSKVGANYGPTIKTQRKGMQQHGCDQVLWLLHDYATEVGTMNLLMHWTNEDGVEEVITPPLDGTILPGVTRSSMISLMREWNEF